MGPTSLAGMLKISVQEAKAFIAKFLSSFAGVNAFIQKTISEAKKTGEVRTILGRRRVLDFEADENRAARQAVNSVIQGSAADIIKLAMIELDIAIKKNHEGCGDSKLLLQIHDELVYEVKNTSLPQMRTLLKQKMESALPLSVPITTTM